MYGLYVVACQKSIWLPVAESDQPPIGMLFSVVRQVFHAIPDS